MNGPPQPRRQRLAPRVLACATAPAPAQRKTELRLVVHVGMLVGATKKAMLESAIFRYSGLWISRCLCRLGVSVGASSRPSFLRAPRVRTGAAEDGVARRRALGALVGATKKAMFESGDCPMFGLVDRSLRASVAAPRFPRPARLAAGVIRWRSPRATRSPARRVRATSRVPAIHQLGPAHVRPAAARYGLSEQLEGARARGRPRHGRGASHEVVRCVPWSAVRVRRAG